MKKLTLLLMAAVMCGTLGCDTEIPNDEVADILTPETRCLMSGGIPLASNQIEAVKKDIEDNKIPYGTGKVLESYGKIYKTVEPQPKDSTDYYCACSTDVCAKGTGCTQTNGYTTCSTVTFDANDTECDPVKVDRRFFGYLLSTHLFPIMRQIAGLRAIQAKAEANDATAQQQLGSLLTSDALKTGLLKSAKYSGKNFSDLAACKTDGVCSAAMVASLFYASIAECMNEGTANCPEGMVLTVEGAEKSSAKAAGFYAMIRSIAAHLLSKDENKTEDQEAIDEFIIEQVTGIYNATVDLSNLMNNDELNRVQSLLFEGNSVAAKLDDDKKVLLKPSDINVSTAKAITTALKNFLVGSYGRLDADRYAAHRVFFAHFVLRSMSNEDKANLFSLTFMQNTRCQDVTSVTGHAAGYAQYCHNDNFQSVVSSMETLAKAIIPTGNDGEDNAAYLADGIIMDTEFSTEGKKVDSTLLPVSLTLNLSDESESNQLKVGPKDSATVIKGKWYSYKCGMGASCTVNNECGVCANSNVRATRMGADGKIHQDAICVSGAVVE